MELEELSIEYDRIYEEVDRLFKEYNPCQFENGQCVSNRRHNTRAKADGHPYPKSNGCCPRDCKYLGPNGCTTRSLGCKLMYCSYPHNVHGDVSSLKEFFVRIDKLRREAYRMSDTNYKPVCFQNKEQFLRAAGGMR